MFGGLGKFFSESAERFRQSAYSYPEHGYRVMKVDEGSSAELSGLEPLYDFVLEVDGQNFEFNGQALLEYVRNSAREMTMKVFSIKGQSARDVYLRALPTPDTGMALQYCKIGTAIENVWHILEVSSNSPAQYAGLHEYEDYVVASPEGSMRGEPALGELIQDFMGKPLRLYIYNQYENSTRQITIVPNRYWGGDGALGCGVGYGALHRIPAPLREGRPAQPGENVFDQPHTPVAEGAKTADNFFIPAEANNDESTPPPVVRKQKKSKHAASTDISALMNEEEMKSKSEDVVPSNLPKDSGSEPPPPRRPSESQTEQADQSEAGDDQHN